jgi:GAF domain-containing protein
VSKTPLALEEASRITTLRACQVLDTPSESTFDDLASLAAQIAGTPIAWVSLVDETREWFKATVGLSITETPREQSFGAHVILRATPLTVTDATQDARFAMNPMVTGVPSICFYHGIPLDISNGARLGSLCVIDRMPRTLSFNQQESLAIVARQVVTQLELRRTRGELAELRALGQLAEREASTGSDQRLGSRLRDGPLQELAGIAHQLSALTVQAHQQTLKLARPLDQLIAQLRRTIRTCGRIAEDHRVNWLLRDALRGRLERLIIMHGSHCSLDLSIDPTIRPDIGVGLRIVEFAECAVRSSIARGAKELRVRALQHNEEMELIIDSDQFASKQEADPLVPHDGEQVALQRHATALNAILDWPIGPQGHAHLRCRVPLKSSTPGPSRTRIRSDWLTKNTG